jgi:pimeloyl-ACP methyl ester carboxylesterase
MTDISYSEAPCARPPLVRLFDEAGAFFKPQRTSRWRSVLAEAPRGDGHAVLVLPPALHGDGITTGIRALLGRLNYEVFGWGLGPNIGPSRRLVDGVQRRLDEVAAEHGPVSIVGYSMGGLFARWLAHRSPASVRQVITVCSPFREPLTSCSPALAPLCWRWSGSRERALAAMMSQPIPVPGTYLYSRDDGIVGWASCLERPELPGRNIEFEGSHVTITSNPSVTRILTEQLAAVHRLD